MSTQRKLLERSLEVITLFAPGYGLLIEEIEAELAKPEQEPVGEVYKTNPGSCFTRDIKWFTNGDGMPPIGTKFYTSPPQYKPLSDDDIKEVIFDMFGLHGDKAYELKILIGNDLPGFARAIEKRITDGKK